mmetsp:Transcript_31138/g.39062  ORF Transcript_31138/g.39062 Transcript_31138/m.39062 type:complete len:92 (-) Transcript_31138:381-656(-)
MSTGVVLLRKDGCQRKYQDIGHSGMENQLDPWRSCQFQKISVGPQIGKCPLMVKELGILMGGNMRPDTNGSLHTVYPERNDGVTLQEGADG